MRSFSPVPDSSHFQNSFFAIATRKAGRQSHSRRSRSLKMRHQACLPRRNKRRRNDGVPGCRRASLSSAATCFANAASPLSPPTFARPWAPSMAWDECLRFVSTIPTPAINTPQQSAQNWNRRIALRIIARLMRICGAVMFPDDRSIGIGPQNNFIRTQR